MKRLAVYNTTTGVIEQMSIASTLASMLMACSPDQSAIEVAGDVSDTTHYVKDGAAIAYPERPAGPHVWNPTTEAWDDPRTLAARRSDKWTAIKARREVAEFGGFTWDGSIFDSDSQSQSRIQGGAQLATLAMLSSQAFSVDWTLQDNTVRTLSGADMLAVGEAMGVHIMTVHGTGRALRDAIEAATTVAGVEAVAWPA